MSWVGPDWSAEVGSDRHGLKPGVTGLVQLHRAAGREEKDKLDAFYMKQFSVGLDVGILFKSVFHQTRHGA
jgi:lipopolysaccharide/colanic/teichoic acid biosynthesis glycosyltransferase